VLTAPATSVAAAENAPWRRGDDRVLDSLVLSGSHADEHARAAAVAAPALAVTVEEVTWWQCSLLRGGRWTWGSTVATTAPVDAGGGCGDVIAAAAPPPPTPSMSASTAGPSAASGPMRSADAVTTTAAAAAAAAPGPATGTLWTTVESREAAAASPG